MPQRIYEVTHSLCFVREEPSLHADVLGQRRRGTQVKAEQVTMDGWVKLADEPGWMVTHLRGVHGLGEMLRPVDAEASGHLVIDGYHEQGLCCLDVVFDQVPVRRRPDRSSQALQLRRRGERVFARAQRFDGWLRLVAP